MKKALTLTVQEVQELPQPLTLKLNQTDEAPGHSVSVGTGIAVGEEVVLELCYSGELVGAVRLQIGEVAGVERKWVAVQTSAELRLWKDVEGREEIGPRVLISIEPTRPLSPIIEQPEPSDGSLLSSLSHSSSPSLSHNPSLPDFPDPALRVKDLQLRVMELEQTLARERWTCRVEMEQAEGRYRVETGKLGIVLEKMKAAVKKEASQCEELKSLLSAAETRIQALDLSNQETLHLLSQSQDQVAAYEASLSEKDREKRELEEELVREIAKKEGIEREMSSLKETLRVEKERSREGKQAAERSSLHDLRQTISSLQSALSLSTSELDSHKAKSKALEVTIHTLQASMSQLDQTPVDLIEELVQGFSRTHALPVPIVRLGEGQYSIGSKKVCFGVKEGGLAIKVGGGLMALEEFLKMYGPVSQSLIHKPRLLSQDSLRRSAQNSPSPQLPRKSLALPIHFRTDSDPSESLSAPRTDRSQVLKPRNSREISPRPIWRETVSSHNKSAPKPSKSKAAWSLA